MKKNSPGLRKVLKDTRPSFYGSQVCNLNETEAEIRLQKFKEFYEEWADKLIWSNEYAVDKGNRRYFKADDYLDEINRLAIDEHKGNCAFNEILRRELIKLGFPAATICISMTTTDGKITGNHLFAVYKYKGQNYCADLTSATKSKDCDKDGSTYEHGEQKMLWHEPFAQHVAEYTRIGTPMVRYGKVDFKLNYFKEYDEVYNELMKPEIEAYHKTKRIAKKLPFFNKDYLGDKGKYERIFKFNKHYRPFNFKKEFKLWGIPVKVSSDAPQELKNFIDSFWENDRPYEGDERTRPWHDGSVSPERILGFSL